MYFIIEMPLNADGEGPEMDPEKVVEIVYQVWDDCFTTVAEFESSDEATEWIRDIL